MTARARFVAVVRPAAGRGTAATTTIRLARSLREAGAEVDVLWSRSLAHATELAADAPRAAAVLAVGGDGLVGAVATALAGTGIEMGVVPAGRGDALARALPPMTAEALLTARARPIDVARAGGRVVVGSLRVGRAVRIVVRRRPITYDLVVDGVPERFRGHTVVVSNAPCYDDGLLDLVTVGDVSRRVREVTIAPDRPAPVYADGERLPDGPVTIRVHPVSLTLIGA